MTHAQNVIAMCERIKAIRLKLDAITAQPPVSSLTSKGRS